MSYLLLIYIVAFLHFDKYIDKREKNIFAACIAVSLILNLRYDLDLKLLGTSELNHWIFLKTLNSFVGYTIRPTLLWGMWELLRGEKKKYVRRIFQVLLVGNFLIFTTCFYTELSFGYRADTYYFFRGPLGFTAHVVMAIMMFLFIPTLVQMYRKGKKRDFYVGIFTLLMALVVVWIETETDKSYLQYVVTMQVLLYYFFLHQEEEKEYTRAMLVAQKAEIMLMQIKPHFINNTLGTIQALCEIDPLLASKTTGLFARYLRMNMTAMDKLLPIPICEEIEHTKTYLEIEMLRFPWIKAEYDIQDLDFCVPVLSIQPLVENAVQHGLRKQKHGKIRISTEWTEAGHLVKIADNGVGFDEKNPVTQEGHGIGIKNVRYRIETISQGTMQIESHVNEGTTITICIPLESMEHGSDKRADEM